MPTIFSHAVAGAALGAVMLPRNVSRKLLWAGALCTVIPDLDVAAFAVGIAYHHPLGHRGFTHSLLFALLLGGVVALMCRRHAGGATSGLRLFAFFALCTASHGLLDALTNGGTGVAFFSPFGLERYFFPVTPIEVSPIGVGFFSMRGLATLASELLWIWLPAGLVLLSVWLMRRLLANPRN